MRRLIAILLMLLVPLQLAWSAAENARGHLGDKGPVVGLHDHGDALDHHHSDADRGSIADGFQQDHDDDGHHGSHYHPIFSMLLLEHTLSLGEAPPQEPPTRPRLSFTSHIPLLFDQPPLVPA